MRVTEHWKRLPRDVVDFPPLEIFKSCLDVALGNLLWVLEQGGFDQMTSRSPFKPQSFFDPGSSLTSYGYHASLDCCVNWYAAFGVVMLYGILKSCYYQILTSAIDANAAIVMQR